MEVLKIFKYFSKRQEKVQKNKTVQIKRTIIGLNIAITIITLNNNGLGFPGGAVVRNLPANAGDTGLSPGPGGSHMPQSN